MYFLWAYKKSQLDKIISKFTSRGWVGKKLHPGKLKKLDISLKEFLKSQFYISFFLAIEKLQTWITLSPGPVESILLWIHRVQSWVLNWFILKNDCNEVIFQVPQKVYWRGVLRKNVYSGHKNWNIWRRRLGVFERKAKWNIAEAQHCCWLMLLSLYVVTSYCYFKVQCFRI